jgi:hypothetical protein
MQLTMLPVVAEAAAVRGGYEAIVPRYLGKSSPVGGDGSATTRESSTPAR